MAKRKPRSWWTDYKPNLSALNRPVTEGYVHYTVARPKSNRARDQKAFMRGIEAFHRNQGYAAIAYHTVVFGNGRRVVGRPATKQGGATYGRNSVSLAVCAALDADDRTTKEMVTGIVQEFRRFVRRRHMTRRASIRPHSAVRQTSCPGPSLTPKVDNIRRRVRA